MSRSSPHQPLLQGSVRFRGASYDDIHEPLVAPEVWYRVQAVLTALRELVTSEFD